MVVAVLRRIALCRPHPRVSPADRHPLRKQRRAAARRGRAVAPAAQPADRAAQLRGGAARRWPRWGSRPWATCSPTCPATHAERAGKRRRRAWPGGPGRRRGHGAQRRHAPDARPPPQASGGPGVSTRRARWWRSGSTSRGSPGGSGRAPECCCTASARTATSSGSASTSRSTAPPRRQGPAWCRCTPPARGSPPPAAPARLGRLPTCSSTPSSRCRRHCGGRAATRPRSSPGRGPLPRRRGRGHRGPRAAGVRGAAPAPARCGRSPPRAPRGTPGGAA